MKDRVKNFIKDLQININNNLGELMIQYILIGIRTQLRILKLIFQNLKNSIQNYDQIKEKKCQFIKDLETSFPKKIFTSKREGYEQNETAETISYYKNFYFAILYNAGHFVHNDLPIATLKMVTHFLNDDQNLN
ncbi:unnamed protein product [Paramecium pentaurelia]|uniref:Uncharacterized protein n=1 Tax=Paramecium pentaurelia TaxID=43138 RepID=A0A8S1TKV2_9CILI|nr:unnamed protein product [Paramecium pentaurelia]